VGGGDQEDQDSRSAQIKNVCETSSPQKKAGRGGAAVIPAMAGNVNRIMVYVALGNN
jgi:hypothetical protein